MWPFKRKAPRVYLIDIYRTGREERRVVPAIELGDGNWAVKRFKTFDEILMLAADGKIVGDTTRRWEVLDDIPGLTDDMVTPDKTIATLTEWCNRLEAHLRNVVDNAKEFEKAKSGRLLSAAQYALKNSISAAESALRVVGMLRDIR